MVLGAYELACWSKHHAALMETKKSNPESEQAKEDALPLASLQFIELFRW